MTTRFLRWVTITFTAMVLQAVTGMVLIGDRIGPPPGEPAALLVWSLVSTGLIAGVLLALAGRSRWNWHRSVPALFGLVMAPPTSSTSSTRWSLIYCRQT
jgi:hypothetical protein